MPNTNPTAQPGPKGAVRSYGLFDASQLTAAGLAAVLVMLLGFGLAVALVTQQAGTTASIANSADDAVQGARYGVRREEELEWRYRLEPGAEVLALHRAGEMEVATLLIVEAPLAGPT